jgi:predicted DNA-binding transcriptional regulator AlpA
MRWTKREDLAFPRPIPFLPGRVFFSADEVEAWLAERVKTRKPHSARRHTIEDEARA